MQEKLKRLLNIVLCYVLSAVLTLQPMLVYASEGISVDTAATAANRATLDNAQNGVPIVNIVNPNANGLSHNKFTHFNVGQEGVIINNSRELGVSTLGGAILGNSNLSREATIILNEVTRSNRSALNGPTEIFGGRAQYILANPSGITCNGCGFINTPRVTLSTGSPVLNNDGGLYGFDVQTGDISFEGLGFNGIDENLALDSFDIISRAAKIATNLHLKGDLNVITGVNEVANSDLAVTPKTANNNKPTYAIDSSVLGGMYANKIKLIATEAGVGVRTNGTLVTSASDMVITADGTIEYASVNAARNIAITSTSHDIKQTADAYANGNMVLDAAGDIELSGSFAAAKGNLQLEADGAIRNTGLAMAGADATVANDAIAFQDNGAGTLHVNAANGLTNQGQIQGSAVNVTGAIANSGTIDSVGDMVVNAGNGEIRNTADGVIGGKNLTLNSTQALMNAGLIKATESLTANVGQVDNQNSHVKNAENQLIKGMIAGNTLSVTTTSGQVNNHAGAMVGQNLLISSAGGITNSAGLMQGSDGIRVNATSLDNSNTWAALNIDKGLLSNGAINITLTHNASNTLDNTSGVIDGSDITMLTRCTKLVTIRPRD